MATHATPATSTRVKFTVRLDPRLHHRLMIDAGVHGRSSVTEHLASILDEHIPPYDELTAAR